MKASQGSDKMKRCVSLRQTRRNAPRRPKSASRRPRASRRTNRAPVINDMCAEPNAFAEHAQYHDRGFKPLISNLYSRRWIVHNVFLSVSSDLLNICGVSFALLLLVPWFPFCILNASRKRTDSSHIWKYTYTLSYTYYRRTTRSSNTSFTSYEHQQFVKLHALRWKDSWESWIIKHQTRLLSFYIVAAICEQELHLCDPGKQNFIIPKIRIFYREMAISFWDLSYDK